MSGKTAAGIVWILKGNPEWLHAPRTPYDISYVNHFAYRALVLRKNIIDLADWIDKATRIYGSLGAVFRERPVPQFEFPSGAKVVLGHLDDGDTYNKYFGQEFQRLLLEEATLVPDLRSYLMVLSCIRSVYSELRAQVLLTTNPGGPGHSWVRDRFVQVKRDDGSLFAPNSTITDRETGETRIYVPSRLTDNPTLMADPSYKRRLMMLPEAERKALLEGDWNALSGVAFTEFRLKPLTGEPSEAQHVIPARPLAPWLHRWMACDWGYAHDAAVYWGAVAEDSRVHVYREMVRRGMGPEQLGFEIAKATIADLDRSDTHHMTLFLSPDAFDKRTDQRTVAEQLAAGVGRVLGPDAVQLVDGDPASDDAQAEFQSQMRGGITIRKAPNQRVAGLQYLRSLMRWWPINPLEVEPYSDTVASNLLHDSAEKFIQYRKMHQRRLRAELLPGLLIHDSCPRLIETLQTVVRDERNPEDVQKTEGDDCYDAFRYLVFAHSKTTGRKPLNVFARERLMEMSGGNPDALSAQDRYWICEKARESWMGEQPINQPFFVPRAAGRRARAVN